MNILLKTVNISASVLLFIILFTGLFATLFVRLFSGKNTNNNIHKLIPFGFLIPGGSMLCKIIQKLNASFPEKAIARIISMTDLIYGRYICRTIAEAYIYVKYFLILVFADLIIVTVTIKNAENELIALLLLMLVISYFLPSLDLKYKIKKRINELELDLPYFVYQLALLSASGMRISRAWEYASESFSDDRALGRELKITLAMISAGHTPYDAYEHFARRCRLNMVSRLVTSILQGMKLDEGGIPGFLRILTSECWESRKHTIRRLAGESASKMIIPMVMILVSIIIIVSAPAFINLSSFKFS